MSSWMTGVQGSDKIRQNSYKTNTKLIRKTRQTLENS